MRHSEEWWAKNIDVIADKYYHSSATLGQLAEENNCSKTTIQVRLKKNGYGPIEDRTLLRKNAFNDIKVNYFDDINTEEKAYFLGLITTDGHISQKGTVMFAFVKSDIGILKKLQRELNCNYPIKFKSDGDKYVTLNIPCKHLTKRLEEMGLNNNKSKWFDFQKVKSYVPEELLHHFVRGMFDGDGSIRYYKYPYFKKHSYHFGFTGIKDTVDFFHSYFNLGTKIVDEGNYIYTCVSDNRAKILAAKDILYKDATCYICRKKNTFDTVQLICASEL